MYTQTNWIDREDSNRNGLGILDHAKQNQFRLVFFSAAPNINR